MLITAPWILPVSSPAISNGGLLIDKGLVKEIFTQSQLIALGGSGSKPRFHLPNSVILPGLVNAHCHLDYTRMAGLIPPPASFTSWIHAIQGLKREWDKTDYQTSWLEGAQASLRNGITTVCNQESRWDFLPEITTQTPLRVMSCLEIIGVSSNLGTYPKLDSAREFLHSHSAHLWNPSLSPHAPYSTTQELLELIALENRSCDSLLTMHVSESLEEWQMFTQRAGPLFDWLSSQRNMEDCDGRTPLEQVSKAGLLNQNLLAVHANYLSNPDLLRLAESGASIVHCPRSYDYFQHSEFPLNELLKQGVRVCIGTDSLATTLKDRGKTPQLNLFEEIRSLAARIPELSAEQLLRLVTIDAAKALKIDRLGIGQLVTGGVADLVALPMADSSITDPYEVTINYTGQVQACMVGGNWVHPPPN